MRTSQLVCVKHHHPVSAVLVRAELHNGREMWSSQWHHIMRGSHRRLHRLGNVYQPRKGHAARSFWIHSKKPASLCEQFSRQVTTTCSSACPSPGAASAAEAGTPGAAGRRTTATTTTTRAASTSRRRRRSTGQVGVREGVGWALSGRLTNTVFLEQ